MSVSAFRLSSTLDSDVKEALRRLALMKIVIFSNPYWPSVGGVESGARLLARCLADAGHQVTVFTSTPGNSEELNEGYSVCRSRSLLRLVLHARRSDLVVIRGGVSARAGLGGILAQRPKLVMWHEMSGPYGHPGNSLRVKALNVLRKWIVSRVPVHVGLTESCLESKKLPASIEKYVIPTPVDAKLIGYLNELQHCHRDVDVLYVGRLIEGKGIFTLAEALIMLGRQGVQLCVRVVGDGEDRKRMEVLLIGKQGVSIEFAGNETGKDLALSYASARMLVVPSTTHPEGQAIVVAEGMAFGLPVIVSDQAALREAAGEAGIVVPAGDAKALASALHRLSQSKALREEFSNRALIRSVAFRMDRFQLSINDLVRAVAR